MTRVLSHLGITALTLVAGSALVAQTATTGQINGKVTARDGSPVAGVNVRVESGQMSRTVLTDASGHYQLGLINPGPVKVTFTKAGHISQTMRGQISIAQAFTLNMAGFAKDNAATVEVVATSSNLDASSTTTGSNFQFSALENMPVGRDMNDIAFMTPGVSSSGFGNAAGTALGLQISISGASGAENSFSIDGLKTNDMRYGGQGMAMTNEFIDQIDVQTGGFKPEYSSMGGVFNATTKSGTNEYAGTAWATFSPGTMSPGPKSNPYYAEQKANSVSDIGAWTGGALIKDVLFYSVGLNYQQTDTPASQNSSDLTIGKVSTPNYQFFTKINYFINTDNQLTFSYFGNNQTATSASGATLGTTNGGYGNQQTAGKAINNTNNLNLIYDITLTPTMYLSIKAGQSNILNNQEPGNNSSELVEESFYQAADGSIQPVPANTQWTTGGYGRIARETNKANQFSVDFSWILGDHSLKTGFSDLRSTYDLNESNTGPQSSIWTVTQGADGTAQINQRLYTNNSEAKAEFQSIYLQDTWQVNKNLNLFYGGRAEHQMQKGTTGQTFMDFKFGSYIQPRIGFTWDINADSKSKVSGSYAMYYEAIPQRLAIRTYGNENYQSYGYGNGSGTAAIPWSNLCVTNPAAVVAGMAPGSDLNYSLGWSQDPQADGLKLPRRVELQFGYDQQISDTTTLGVHTHYRKLTNVIEDSEITQPGGNGIPADPYDTTPGGQALLWNPHAGSVSWTDLEGHHVTVANSGYPTAFNEYQAVDFSYTRKTSSNLLSISYTWSRLFGNYEGLISSSNGQMDSNISSAFDYPPYVGTGLLPLDHTHTIKAYGYQRMPLGTGTLILGFNFIAQSGSPTCKQDNGLTNYGAFPNGGTGAYSGSTSIGDPGGYQNNTFLNSALGTFGRTPFTTKLDFTIHYEVEFSKRVRLEPLFEIYNVLNARPALTIYEQTYTQSGVPVPDQYGTPTMYQAPRSFRFGARFRF